MPFEPLDIDDAFEEFMHRVNPRVREHEVQYKESRRCFFAGAAALYFHLTQDITALPEDAGMRQLERIRQQLLDFGKRVEEDRD